MKGAFFNGKYFTAFLGGVVVLSLFLSFGLHSVQVAHEHPGHADAHTTTGEQGHDGTQLTLGEYAHMAEKKLLLLLLGVILLSLGIVTLFQRSWTQFLNHREIIYSVLYRRRKNEARAITDYLTLGFSQGLLNPKLH